MKKTQPLDIRVPEKFFNDNFKAIKETELLTAYTTHTGQWSLASRYRPLPEDPRQYPNPYPEFWSDAAKLPFETVFDALELGKKYTREMIGAAVLDWEHRKDFRYNTWGPTIGLATFEHYFFEALKKDFRQLTTLATGAVATGAAGAVPGVGGILGPRVAKSYGSKLVQQLGEDQKSALGRMLGPLYAAFEYATEYTIRDAKDGWTWAKGDPEAVEAWASGTLDPLIYTTFIEGRAAKMIQSAEVKRIMPIAESLLSAGKARVGEKTAEIFRHAMKMEGGDIVRPEFHALIEQAARNDMSPAELGEILVTTGFTAPHASIQWVKGKIPVEAMQYFRRANTVYSPVIGKLGKMADLEVAVSKHNFHKAIERIGPVYKEELEPLQWALHNVPRTFEDPINSFKANYLTMQANGQAPFSLMPETVEKASRIVGEVGMGWRQVTPAELKAQGVMMVGDSGWMSAYGPSTRAVLEHELAKLGEKLPTSKRMSKFYRMNREGSHFIMDPKDFKTGGIGGMKEMRVPEWEPVTLSADEIDRMFNTRARVVPRSPETVIKPGDVSHLMDPRKAAIDETKKILAQWEEDVRRFENPPPGWSDQFAENLIDARKTVERLKNKLQGLQEGTLPPDTNFAQMSNSVSENALNALGYYQRDDIHKMLKQVTAAQVSPIFHERLAHALWAIGEKIRAGVYKKVTPEELSALLKHPPLRTLAKDEQAVSDFIDVARAAAKKTGQVKFPAEKISGFFNWLRKEGLMEQAGSSPEEFLRISKEYGLKLLKDSKGYYKDADGFINWLAGTATRVARTDGYNGVIDEAMLYKRNLAEVERHANAQLRSHKTSMADYEMWQETRDNARFLTKQINRMVRSMKQGKTNDGIVRQLRDTEVLPYLKAYQAGMNLWKTGVLGANPAWHMKNLQDSVGWKTLLATGGVDTKALKASLSLEPTPPIFGFTGKQLLTEEIPGGNAMGLDSAAGGVTRLGNYTSGLADVVQNNARRAVFGATYKSYGESLLAKGFDVETAHKMADDFARKVTNEFQYEYAIVPPVVKDMSIVFPWANFMTQEMALLGKTAAKYPGEFYTVMRGREALRSSSADGRGAMVEIPLPDPISGQFTHAFDPLAGASLMRHIDNAIEAKNAGDSNATLPAPVAAARVAQMMLGSTSPVGKMILQKTGVEFDRGYGSSVPQEELIRATLKTAGITAPTPTDFLYDAFGGASPLETRDSWRERRAAFLEHATELNEQMGAGKAISREEARKVVDYYDLVGAGTSLGGQRVVVDGPGFQEALKRLGELKYIRNHLDPSDANSAAYVREVLMDERYRGLWENAPKPQYMKDKAISFGERAGRLADTEIEKEAKLEQHKQRETELLKIFETSPLGGVINTILGAITPPAGAAEMKTEPLAYAGVSKEKLVSHATHRVKEGRMTDDALLDMRQLPSAEAKFKYAEARGWTQLTPTGEMKFRELARRSGTKEADGLFEEVRLGMTQGQEGLHDLGDTTGIQVRTRIGRALNNWVEAGGHKYEERARMVSTVEGARKVAAMPNVLPLNLTPEHIDQTALNVMESMRDGGFGNRAIARWESKMQGDYHDFGKYVGMLQDATRSPRRMEKVLEQGKAWIAEGRLPEDIHDQLGSVTKYRNLMQNVGIAASFPEAEMIMGKLISRGHDGRPRAVNMAGLFAVAFDPKHSRFKPYVEAALGGYYGNEFASVLQTSIQRLPPAYQRLIEDSFVISPEAIEGHMINEAKIASGYLGDLGKAIRSIDPNFKTVSLGQASRPIPVSPLAADLRSGRIEAVDERINPRRMLEGEFGGRGGPSQIPEIVNQIPSTYTPSFFQPSSSYSRPAYGSFREMYNETLGQYYFERKTYAYFQSNGWWADRDGSQRYDAPMEPELAVIAGKNFSDAFAGGRVQDTAFAAQIVQAVNSSAQGLYRSAIERGDIQPGGDLGAAMHGLNVGMNTLMNPAELALNATTFGAYGIWTGIKSGLNFGKRNKGNDAARAEQQRLQNERIEILRQQQAEQLRQQSIRDLRTREADLANAIRGGARPNPAALQEPMLRFQRRGTFASKIGLVDAIERELSSALKPRY